MTQRRPRRLLAVLALVVAAAVLGTVAWRWWSTTASDDPDIVHHGHPPDAPYRAFYEPPSPLPAGAPGDLIRAASFDIQPPGAHVHRLLYHSRTAADDDIAVSGLLITPTTDPPSGGFPLIAFAHPTVGISEKCAVSANLFIPLIPADVQNFYQIYFEPFVRAGFAVVATDYQGMGAPGPYSYLVGEIEGRNVLDIARAARQVDGVQISARVAIVGHSQGGHGGLFARQIAAAYAPELTITGSAFAAPAADLHTILDAVLTRTERTPLTGMVAMTAVSWVETYAPALALRDLMSSAGIATTKRLGEHCILLADLGFAERPPAAYFPVNPASVPAWADVIARNTPDTGRIETPLLIAQGEADAVVPFASTETFVEQARAGGNDITFHPYPGAGHMSVLHQAMPAIVTWISNRFADSP
ncbi:MAG: lipase family protein [Dehalococcoidia bacterium]